MKPLTLIHKLGKMTISKCEIKKWVRERPRFFAVAERDVCIVWRFADDDATYIAEGVGRRRVFTLPELEQHSNAVEVDYSQARAYAKRHKIKWPKAWTRSAAESAAAKGK